jgi:anti-sigma B factor antagonist
MVITTVTATGRVPVTILRLKGNLDASTYQQLEDYALDAMKSGAKDLLLDLSDVHYISSAGLRALNSLYQRLHPDESISSMQVVGQGVRDGTYQSPHLKLLNPSQRVREVLSLAGFDMFLDIHDAEPDAINAF